MADNASLEKLIETSILFVSVTSVIGLTLGGLVGQYRIAYINLGKMLYYSFPFIIASLLAFFSIIAKNGSVTTKVKYVKELALSSYLTGFIFIMLLASLATQTEYTKEENR